MIRVAWLGSLLAGLALMLPFESDVTLILGLLCLGAFIVLGVVLVAGPAAIGDDEPPHDGGSANRDADVRSAAPPEAS